MTVMHGLLWAALVLTAAVGYATTAGQRQPRDPFPGVLDEHPVIRYADAPATDRVGRLAAAIARGDTTLTSEEPGGYLKPILRALDISPESQLLVFSKTGVQRVRTSPRNPRALYFDDSVVVGYIPGARYLEIASHDPEQGVIFYTVDQVVTSAPEVSRQMNCLTCHVSGSTLDIPGLITRSNFTNAEGELIPQLGFHIVDHRTPLPQRWGGWFVTGKYDLAPYGGVTHMGNVATVLHAVTGAAAGTSNEIFVRWLGSDAAALGYASHDSDIAALMVFDHQARAINLLTRLNWESRVAAHEGRDDFSRGELRALADQVAEYLVFADEVPPPARLTPRPGFAARFMAVGPKDARGRSLRELDLTERLFRYACSFMIYSPAFDRLPRAARQAVYQRMSSLLNAPADAPGTELDTARRRTTLEILRDTKPDWPTP
jgi:hypothetical protein